MYFNNHKNLEGKHSILSPSTWRWINDDPEALMGRLCGQYATTIGTLLHHVAYKHIKYRIKLHKYDRSNVLLELLSNGVPFAIIDAMDFEAMFENLMTYVNDGIGFRMDPEIILYYSNNCFGTADTIAYSERDCFLRIHDYKSGTTPAKMEQLMVYEALFCLEYKIKPNNISSELRLYQNNGVTVYVPSSEEILAISNTIVTHDNFIKSINEEV